MESGSRAAGWPPLRLLLINKLCNPFDHANIEIVRTEQVTEANAAFWLLQLN